MRFENNWHGTCMQEFIHPLHNKNYINFNILKQTKERGFLYVQYTISYKHWEYSNSGKLIIYKCNVYLVKYVQTHTPTHTQLHVSRSTVNM